jgi:hypothetical protein
VCEAVTLKRLHLQHRRAQRWIGCTALPLTLDDAQLLEDGLAVDGQSGSDVALPRNCSGCRG